MMKKLEITTKTVDFGSLLIANDKVIAKSCSRNDSIIQEVEKYLNGNLVSGDGKPKKITVTISDIENELYRTN